MAGEKIVYRVTNTEVINPETVRVEITCQMSAPVLIEGSGGFFTGGNPTVDVQIDITESELRSILDALARDWVMGQTVPNVYTLADVRRIA